MHLMLMKREYSLTPGAIKEGGELLKGKQEATASSMIPITEGIQPVPGKVVQRIDLGNLWTSHTFSKTSTLKRI